MGADMVVNYVTIQKNRKPNWAKATKAINKLSKTPLNKWPKAFLADQFDDENPEGETSAENAKVLENDLQAIKNGWDNSHRCFVNLLIDRKRVLLTGGMSWGDTPTDAYVALTHLGNAGITKAAGFDW